MTTETSLRVSPMPLSRMPPRAVSVTANSTSSWASTRPAPLGPGVVARPRPARRRRRCRRCWTSRRACPSVRAMWAIIREVVVLPLVPVTATTGTRGVIVCGAAPGSAAATRSAAAPTAASMSAPGHGVEHVGHRATHLLGARPGAPTGRRPRSGAGRWSGAPERRAATYRTPRRSPAPAAPTARSANRCRKPGLRPRPGARSAARSGVANRAAVSSEAARQPADVQGQLDRRPREVEVRALRGPAARRVRTARAHGSSRRGHVGGSRSRPGGRSTGPIRQRMPVRRVVPRTADSTEDLAEPPGLAAPTTAAPRDGPSRVVDAGATLERAATATATLAGDPARHRAERRHGVHPGRRRSSSARATPAHRRRDPAVVLAWPEARPDGLTLHRRPGRWRARYPGIYLAVTVLLTPMDVDAHDIG